MKILTNWSLTKKLTAGLSVILFLFIISFVLNLIFKEREKKDSVIVDISGRNLMLSQKIAYLCEQVVAGIIDKKEDLAAIVELHDKSLNVLKEGGIALGFQTNIPGAVNDALTAIKEIEEVWTKYKSRTLIIANSPLKIEKKGYSHHPDSLGIIVSAKEIPNPEVIKAIRYVEQNSEELLKRNNALVTTFVQQVSDKQRFANTVMFFVLLLCLVFTLLFISFFRKLLVLPINSLIRYINSLAHGNIKDELITTGRDEIGALTDSANLMRDRLFKVSTFLGVLSKGNFEIDFEVGGEKDYLGHSLVAMRNNFRQTALAQQEQKEKEARRNWATHGLAKFAEILRNNHNNLELLCYDIISNLVKYMEINQGGIFIINDDQRNTTTLTLMACFAYDRKKFVEKEIRIGEGLVGTCYLEGSTIYMTDVPDGYITITSGLGDRTASSILLVPLKINEEIYGVLELASFKNFERYKIDFVEKVGESIASTISGVKVNMRTATLLSQTQQQAEEMQAQEEEMRQNMEEMMATQEEVSRKEAELQGMVDAIDNTVCTMELNKSGTIEKVNSALLATFGAKTTDLVGKYHQVFLALEAYDENEYKNIWQSVINGRPVDEEKKYRFAGREAWFYETLTPIKNSQGVVLRILVLLIDITENKKIQEEESKAVTERMKQDENLIRKVKEETTKQMMNMETTLFNTRKKLKKELKELKEENERLSNKLKTYQTNN